MYRHDVRKYSVHTYPYEVRILYSRTYLVPLYPLRWSMTKLRERPRSWRDTFVGGQTPRVFMRKLRTAVQINHLSDLNGYDTIGHLVYNSKVSRITSCSCRLRTYYIRYVLYYS